MSTRSIIANGQTIVRIEDTYRMLGKIDENVNNFYTDVSAISENTRRILEENEG
jgi:regulator of replication initiation timing